MPSRESTSCTHSGRTPARRRLRLGALGSAAAAALAISPWGAPEGRAAFPGPNGRIAFTSDRDGNFELYSILPDGSNATRLTGTAAIDEQEPAWSPGGGRLVFERWSGGNPDIWTMDADGSGARALISHPARDTRPSWSPDGGRVAFASDRDGDLEIFVVNADGTGLVQLTSNTVFDSNPVFSPDGSRIAYDSWPGADQEVFVMSSAGTDQRRLTTSPSYDRRPDWSPDGQWLTFASERDGNREIYKMRPDGSQQIRLTNHGAADDNPEWSPAGDLVAFHSVRDGRDQIYAMTPDGGEQRRVHVSPFADRGPTWQPSAPVIARSPSPPAAPPPPSWTLGVATSLVRYDRNRARGAVLIEGSSQRAARVQAELRLEQPLRRATELGPHARPLTVQRFRFGLAAGSFRRRLRVGSRVYPGRYTVSIAELGTPPAGLAPLPVRSTVLTIASPRRGVVHRAFIGRAVGGRPVARFRSPPTLIFANFRFWTLPRRGARVRIAWYHDGRPVGAVRHANFVGPLAHGRIADLRGRLRAGRYRAELRVGTTVVAGAVTRVG